MSGQNGIVKTSTQKELRKKILDYLDPGGRDSYHPVPWIYYKFLTIEEACALAAIYNMVIRSAAKKKKTNSRKFKEIGDHVWLYCSVSFLCLQFDISARVENRIINTLVQKGFIHKKVITGKRMRYIRIDKEAIETAIKNIRKRNQGTKPTKLQLCNKPTKP